MPTPWCCQSMAVPFEPYGKRVVAIQQHPTTAEGRSWLSDKQGEGEGEGEGEV